MQLGSMCNEDQDATRIKKQRGSRCNEDQDATRIKQKVFPKCLMGGNYCDVARGAIEDKDKLCTRMQLAESLKQDSR